MHESSQDVEGLRGLMADLCAAERERMGAFVDASRGMVGGDGRDRGHEGPRILRWGQGPLGRTECAWPRQLLD